MHGAVLSTKDIYTWCAIFNSNPTTDMGPRPWLSLGSATTAITTFIGFLLLFLAVTSQAQSLPTERHFFGSFNTSQINKELYVIPMAWINTGALQLNPKTPRAAAEMINKSGRVFFNKPFKLWEDGFSGRVASFNTSFLFYAFHVDKVTPGEGMAFVIAPSLSIPPLSYGQYLGLTNNLTDGEPSNQIVAIELDTVKQDFDPDDNHVGLDINSVKSNVSVPLSQFGFKIAPSNNVTEYYYVVWVEYDGVKKVIDVYMVEQPDKDAPIAEKPMRPVLTHDLDLKGLVNQMSYLGFSASTGDFYELNYVLKWNLSVEVLSESYSTEGQNGKNKMKIGMGVGMTPLVVLLLVGTISGFAYYVRNKMRASSSDTELLSTLRRLPGTPREFRFHELKKATNNFDEKHKLGQGGFGVVYKGTLPKENSEVAVKKFSRDRMKSIGDFLAELTIINRLRHKNLVRLLGN